MRGKVWFKSLTRELPFHTVRNWRDVYFEGWPKFVGCGLKNVIYYSNRNVVEVYRVKSEFENFLKKLEKFCLEKPGKVYRYYTELERLDKQVVELTKRRVNTKKELKEYINEIDEMMHYYAAMYLIKTYSNYVITDRVKRKNPELAKKAISLIKTAQWFDLSKALWRNTNKIIGIDERIVSLMKLNEISRAIDKGYINYSNIEKRRKYAWNLKRNKFYFGEQADSYIKRLKHVKTERIVRNVKGQVASKGTVRGEVVIALGTEDFPKIRKGCIVVTHMTTPWFTPYLGNVAAIVTDEGGIGTHAAIISRELGIPCITGTRNATKVFKDGDLVEVDGEKGIVRRIK